MSDWAHEMSGWAHRAMCRWCCVGTAPMVYCGGMLRIQGRFVSGTVSREALRIQGHFMRGTVSCIL